MKFHSSQDTRARPRNHQTRRSNFAEVSGDLLATQLPPPLEKMYPEQGANVILRHSVWDNSSLFPLILQSSFQEPQIFIISYTENRYPICTLSNKKWYQNWRSECFV